MYSLEALNHLFKGQQFLKRVKNIDKMKKYLFDAVKSASSPKLFVLLK